MKVEINSAILEEDLQDIKSKLEQSRGLVDFAQVDVCDGKYVPSKTFLSAGCEISAERLKVVTDGVPLELDMMVDWQEPDMSAKWLNALTILQPQRVVIHNTSITDENLNIIFNTIDPTTTEFGLGIHLDDKIEQVVERFDTYPFSYVQIMGIEKVGYGGQGQSGKLIPYIQAFKALRPDVPISIDGGVKLENVKALRGAGATRMTLGSGLFNTTDIKQRVSDLRDRVEDSNCG